MHTTGHCAGLHAERVNEGGEHMQRSEGKTALERIGVGPKLWLCLGFTLAILFVKNIFFGIAVIVASVFVVVHEDKLGLFKVILMTSLVLFVSMYGIYGTMAPGLDKASEPVWFYIGSLPYWRSGIDYATRYYFNVVPLMCALFPLITSIDMGDLGALLRKMGLSQRAAFVFIDSFQLIAQLSRDMQQIKDAQMARGLRVDGNVFQRLKAFVPIMVPVVANSLIKIQDQAVALETRGFNAPGDKTVYRELSYTKTDSFVRMASIFLGLGAICYRVLVVAAVVKPLSGAIS
jgi:energy-coupling factor transport system permease protein